MFFFKKKQLLPPRLFKVRPGEKKVRSERGVYLGQRRALDKGGTSLVLGWSGIFKGEVRGPKKNLYQLMNFTSCG